MFQPKKELYQMRKILLAFLALVSLTALANAQTSSSTSNTLALVVTPFLSCSADRGIDYGTHTRAENGGILFTDATNYAQWTCQTDPGNSANFTFTLPTALRNGGNP